MEKRKTIGAWVKEHRTVIIIAGVTVIVVAGAFFITHKWDSITDVISDRLYSTKPRLKLQPILEPVTITEVSDSAVVSCLPSEKISNVNAFVRNLPEGRKPSELKIATASDYGFMLSDNQTWVRPFSRTYAA